MRATDPDGWVTDVVPAVPTVRGAVPLPLDRVPIVFGVISHPDVAEEFAPLVRARIDALFARHVERFPNTPLVLMAAFAGAGDLIAVEAAVARGVPVVAVLGESIATACARFAAGPERERCSRALQRCARTDIVSGGAGAALMTIAYYSDLVIALWDGSAADGPGDPGAVVTLRMTGLAAGAGIPANLRHTPDAGPVLQIVVPRAGQPVPANALEIIEHYPERFVEDANSAADDSASYAKIERLNCDLARFDVGMFPPTIDGQRDRIGYVCNRLQQTTFRFQYALYAIAIIGTAAQFTNGTFFKYAVFPIAFLFYRYARQYDYENRYQDYRALSEGLRVQAAWFEGGLREPAERSYLGMHQRELHWIRIALRYAFFVFGDAAGNGVDVSGCRPWVDEQWDYFKRKPRIEERMLRRLQSASRAALYVAIAASVACFVVLYVPTLPQQIATISEALPAWLVPGHAVVAQAAQSAQTAWSASGTAWLGGLHAYDVGVPTARPPVPGHHALLEKVLTGALALYAAIALLIANYCDKRGFATNVKRYDRMFAVFDRARRHLAAVPADSSAATAIVTELGRAALVENGDWLVTRRERPLAFVE